MAGTQAKAIRRANVLERLSARLGIEQADLSVSAKGDTELALIMTLERIADAVEAKLPEQVKKPAPQAPVEGEPAEGEPTEAPPTETPIPDEVVGEATVETVEETPPVTTETVETAPVDEAPTETSKPKVPRR